MAVGLNNSLTFGGVDSADYGIFIDGGGVYNSPERDVTMVSIPGRNGDLAIDNGRFQNVEVTYSAFIDGRDDGTIRDRIRDFRNAIGALRGYQRLEDTYNPDEYREALFIGGLEVDPVVYQTGGEFEITFNCKPQRFITAWSEYAEPLAPYVPGDTTRGDVSAFEAHPLIDLFYYQDAAATITLTLGAFTVEIDPTQHQQTSSGYLNVFIDCDLGEAYEYSEGGTSGEMLSANSWVSFPDGIPVIYPEGGQAITLTGPANTAFVIPRYWRL